MIKCKLLKCGHWLVVVGPTVSGAILFLSRCFSQNFIYEG